MTEQETAEQEATGGETTARRIEAHGHVQGVFFRASTRRRARAAGVTGWVRNRTDGAVEMRLEGAHDAVDDVERWVRQGGPERAQVDRIEVDEVRPEGHEVFEIRR